MTQLISTASPVTIGLDVGDRRTHLCVVNAFREIVREGSCQTTGSELLRELSDFPGARVVLEAGSQSPWIARMLRAAGYSVHVADPRRVQLISKDPRKTDRRDARTLALLEAGCPELLGAVFHRGEQAQADLSIVRTRDLVVRMRTMAVQQVRSLSKAFGVRLPSASTRTFAVKVRALVPDILMPAVEPVLDLIRDLTERIRRIDHLLTEVAASRYPEVERLQVVNGVGPIASTAFVLSIETPERFSSSRRVGSWLGLCPRSQASGDRDPLLPISRAGDTYLRRILMQSANYILGPFGKDSDLRRFGLHLLERGGRAARKKAVVAVARKLAVRLHMLWRTSVDYDPLYEAKRRESRTPAAV